MQPSALLEADVCHTAELDCGVDLRAPQRGRRFVAEILDECFGASFPDAQTRGDIALVTTELLTNAGRVAREIVRLSVDVHRAWIEVAVTDDGPGRPQARPTTPDHTSGRGLLIIDAVAAEWGVRAAGSAGRPDGSKSVWVRVPLTGVADRELVCSR